MTEISSNYAFVLGCERSSSTWLSNVLDSHSDTEFFMEPFADYAGLFPGLPSRNVYVDKKNNDVASIISQGYGNLQKSKYWLFYKRNRSLNWKIIDNAIVRICNRFSILTRLSSPFKLEQFLLLNLNLKNMPLNLQVRKSKVPALIITKELRLNFKVGSLIRAFPNAKIIIIVRHPGAQVASILKLLERGHLGELQKSLLSFYKELERSKRFNKYSIPCRPSENEHEMMDLLLFWWLVNYQTLIEDCKIYGAEYNLVFSEDLSSSPMNRYRELFTFLEIDFSQEVKEYINHSTKDKLSRNNSSLISPVDTVRNSKEYSKESISNLDEPMKQSISNLFQNNYVIDELGRYLKRLV